LNFQIKHNQSLQFILPLALNHAEASSKVARANLLYPFNVAKAAPLLYAAAELAGDNFNYWMLCGRAQKNEIRRGVNMLGS